MFAGVAESSGSGDGDSPRSVNIDALKSEVRAVLINQKVRDYVVTVFEGLPSDTTRRNIEYYVVARLAKPGIFTLKCMFDGVVESSGACVDGCEDSPRSVNIDALKSEPRAALMIGKRQEATHMRLRQTEREREREREREKDSPFLIYPSSVKPILLLFAKLAKPQLRA